LTVTSDPTNHKSIAMYDATNTNVFGFRWADSTHFALRDMVARANIMQFVRASLLATFTGGITSTSGANTLGKIVAGVTTDTTSSGLTNNYALPWNTSVLVFNQ